MAIYRTADNLSTGQKRGHAFCATELRPDALEILERKGIIHRIDAPPLALIECFSEVSAELAAIGVVTLDDLLCSNLSGYNCYVQSGWQLLYEPQCKTCKRS